MVVLLFVTLDSLRPLQLSTEGGWESLRKGPCPSTLPPGAAPSWGLLYVSLTFPSFFISPGEQPPYKTGRSNQVLGVNHPSPREQIGA